MLRTILRSIRAAHASYSLPPNAKRERDLDHRGVPARDPEISTVIDEAAAWIGRAEDDSPSKDGGVSREFSLLTGWNASYPETTGYIVPTMIEYSKSRNDRDARARAKRMLDWLVSIQFPDGGFQGSVIGALPDVPVTFNTGQILLGLASGTAEFGDEYRPAMRRAADWLVDTQDADGAWRKYRSPFTEPTDKAYETHVSWGLLEAARLEPGGGYAEAALRNVHWALGLQTPNGWFRNCCLSDQKHPLTHTLAYALRGVIEAYRFTNDEMFLAAAIKTAEGLLTATRDDGSLPGRLDRDWTGTVPWSCLTGNVQIAANWFLLYEYTGEKSYLDAALSANKFVRQTVKLDGDRETRGAIKGSFPISGEYCPYEYPNWAAKFFLDSHLMEESLMSGSAV